MGNNSALFIIYINYLQSQMAFIMHSKLLFDYVLVMSNIILYISSLVPESVALLLMNWSDVFLALTHRHVYDPIILKGNSE